MKKFNLKALSLAVAVIMCGNVVYGAIGAADAGTIVPPIVKTVFNLF